MKIHFATLLAAMSGLVPTMVSAADDGASAGNIRGAQRQLHSMVYPIVDFGSEAHTRPGVLGLCQGDCDVNHHCAEGLMCYQRSKGDPIPGCTGELGSNSDFCVVDPDYVPPHPSYPIVDFGSDAHTRPGVLGLCQGDCDVNHHCAEGLMCYQRSKGDPIPGCYGELGSNSDFCVLASPPSYPIVDFGSDAHTRPGVLGLCQGDCDKDHHCADGLMCYQRSKGDPIPGCYGPLGSNSDFCVIDPHYRV
eukprot:CAMPEP_0119546480 /NCGR_PEP_ID=MMETSP1352-20130426/886_1 /TAXON_ID=265584 /ORGANISM="Stauroneis constricta, Strain CCMP1120" /LENGTH=247 /DNA_ID=CAMNT_0007591191 /DNA_START=98 /DNA_END=841 /DNA_ORIENTATION=+